VFGEYLGGLVAAGQVARVRLPQAAEVDQAPDALARDRARQRFGVGALAEREIAACPSAHGVDQVVGVVDVTANAIEGLGAEDVGLVQLEAALLEVVRAIGRAPCSGRSSRGRRVWSRAGRR
jgi:hypothetical protein